MSSGPSGSKPPGSGDATTGQKLLGYMFAAILVFGIAAALYLALGPGSDDGGPTGNSHIAVNSGSTNGVKPDNRLGTEVDLGTVPPLAQAAKDAQCTLRLNLPNEGQNHLQPEDPVPDYKTNPPTSGDHIAPPLQQADGAYLDPAAPVDIVHSLEHGRINVQYSPDLPIKGQLELKGLYDDNYSGALLYPNPDMPYMVAATAWQNLMGCKTYEGVKTLRAIKAFGAEYLGKAPEPLSVFPSLTGPRFTDS